MINDSHLKPTVNKIFLTSGRPGIPAISERQRTIFIRVLTMHGCRRRRRTVQGRKGGRKEGNVSSSSQGQNGRSLACRVAVSACEKAIYLLLLSTRGRKKVGRGRGKERGKTHPSSALETSTSSWQKAYLLSSKEMSFGGTVPENNTCMWLQEFCGQVEAEVVSNSRNKIHQTGGPPFSRALYMALKP